MPETAPSIHLPSSLPTVANLGLLDMEINRGYVEALNLFHSHEVALKLWLAQKIGFSEEVNAEVVYLAGFYRLAIADDTLNVETLQFLSEARGLVEAAQRHGLTSDADTGELKAGLVNFAQCAMGLSALTNRYKEYVRTAHS
jgi:hypothetical protein